MKKNIGIVGGACKRNLQFCFLSKSVFSALLLLFSGLLLLFSCGTYGAFGEAGGINAPLFPGKYADFLNEGEEEILSRYHFVVSKSADGHFIRRTFFPETFQLTNEEHFLDQSLKVRNGLNRAWYDNGELKHEINYVENKKEGPASYFHPASGQLSSVGTYSSGQEIGSWRKYHPNGNLKAIYEYESGQRNGVFKQWSEEDELMFSGYYKDDIRTVEFTHPDRVDEIMVKPFLKSCAHLKDSLERKQCSDQGLLMHIYRNIRYPTSARNYGISGTAIVEFVITSDGKVEDINCHSCISMDIRKEVLSIIETLPE